MKLFLVISLVFVFQEVFSQKEIDPAALKKIVYKPAVEVNGIRQVQEIKYDSLMKYGLEVVLDDQSFKVLQFDVMYDCHSKSLVDFGYKRYIGSKLPPTDDYFRQRVWIGDAIDIDYTIIARGTEKYVMNTASYLIIK